MKQTMFAVWTTVAVLAGLLVVAVAAGDTGACQRYVVVFHGNKMPRKAAQLVAGAGGELVKTFSEIGVGIATSSNEEFAASLKGAKGIHSLGVERFHALPATEAYVAADGPTPADAYYDAYQWDIRRVQADLSARSQADLSRIALRLNQRPRKTLDFRSPAEVLNESVALTG